MNELEERFAELGSVRPGYVVWPADTPFPWSDAECAAFVRGHMVRWPLSIECLLRDLPGKVELDDGYAVQWNA
jgi:hypothetical protein